MEVKAMNRWRKRSLALAIAVALIFSTAGFQAVAQDQQVASEPTAPGMIADLVLLRPLGIVATAAGTVFFVVSLPFSELGGNSKAAYQKLVVDPARFTFGRPLGKIEGVLPAQ